MWEQSTAYEQSDGMTPSLGQSFVVENQPGAGGNIGTAAIARAEPNGYNLLVSNSGALAPFHS
jgi:tripartite-type tricarboxylate transporter receptor subunit TctC